MPCGDVDHFLSLIRALNVLTAPAWYNSEAVKHCGSTVNAITIVVALTTRSGVTTSIHGVPEGHSAFSYPSDAWRKSYELLIGECEHLEVQARPIFYYL